MRILFLTFYYPPDLSAGSFRSQALVDCLLKRMSAQGQIHVVTTSPNRYASLENPAPEHEDCGAVTIDRIGLPSHRSGVIDQARAFTRFYREARRLTKGKSYDLVFATSSRLMTAFLGARVARRAACPLYLDIRDIFVDTVKDVFSGPAARLLLPILSAIESYTLRSASRVNLVSAGFGSYFGERYPELAYDYFTNGIDDDFLGGLPSRPSQQPGQALRVLYAGNIGEGQGLHRIVPPLAKAAEGKYEFIIVGDGGRRNALVEQVEKLGVTNVQVLPPVPRRELFQYYSDADVLFLHLNDHDAFAKVLPSKLFEYAATGKPMLAGVGGYAADFLRSEVTHCEVFRPCDAEAGWRALQALSLECRARPEFVEKFSRRRIMERMASSVLALPSQASSAASTSGD